MCFICPESAEGVYSLGEDDLRKDQQSDLCFNPVLFKMVPLGVLLSLPWLA